MIKRLLLILVFPALALLVISAAANDHEIGFEAERVGYTFSDSHQAYEDLGIRVFSDGTNGAGSPRVIESFGIAPDGHALRNYPVGEFETSMGQDLYIDFDFMSDGAVLFVGKDEVTIGTVDASLQAWRRTDRGEYRVDVDYIDLPASISGPVNAMVVESHEDLFNRLIISYGSADQSEIVDNLMIDIYDGPPRDPPPDLLPPRVTISVPTNGGHTEYDTITGYIEENMGLESILVTVWPSMDERTLPVRAPVSDSDTDIIRYTFADMGFDFREGANIVTVKATDVSRQSGERSVTFTYQHPDDPPPPFDWPDTMDISANGIEMTQVIQGWGDVGLTPHEGRHLTSFVAGKQTLVRVYGRVEGVEIDVPNVNCKLEGYRGSEELPGSPLYVSRRITLVPGEDHIQQRLIPQKTCNFILPTEWTDAGRIRLDATVNPANGAGEGPGHFDPFNTATETFTFHDTEALCVQVYAINSREEGDVRPTWKECTDNIALMQQLYPVAADRFRVNSSGIAITDRILDTGTTEDDEQLSDLLNAFRRALGFHYGQAYALPCRNTVYLGLTDSTVTHRGITAGEWPVSLSVAHPTSAFFRMKTGHEVGHAMDLDHVQGNAALPWDCDDPDGPYESYPQYTNSITGNRYFQGSIGDWGWNGSFDAGHSTFGMINPARRGDMMSYCGSRWISSYTWKRLFDRFTDDLETEEQEASYSIPAVSAVDPLAAQPSYFIVGGMIDDDGIVHMEPAWTQRMPAGSSDHVGNGPLTLQLMDSSSHVLFTRHFTASANWDVSNQTLFREIVPVKLGTTRITLSGPGLGGSTSISAGSSPPELVINSPGGGEEWPATGSREIWWSATDNDGDFLTFAVMYSHNYGRTWQVIGSDLHSQDRQGLSVDLEQLPGCDGTCLVRVLVTDNINQGMATSLVFSKDGLPPLVSINRPKSVDVFQYGQHINLQGLVTDREDGPLSANRLTWHSDLDGEIGNGARVSFFNPSPGLHQITLAARDSDGQVSSDSIGIYVYSRQNYKSMLPVVVSKQKP